MKCIIIDDEDTCKAVLKQLIQQVSFLELVGVYNGPMEAINMLKNENIDLAFLDIEMPEMTGIEMLKNVDMPPTILTTSHNEYALDAYEHNIVDYLIKPLTLPRFMKAVEKAKSNHDKMNSQKGTMDNEYFFIKESSILTKVPIKNILWIEALGDYLTVHTIDKKYVLHLTLKAIETRLPDKFVRVHRSYIVHIDNVSAIEDNTIYINNVSIPVGALYKENFHEVLNLL